MSVTKLESLPNEILIEIFEKYLNGVDIINAFAFQLNQRFDALVAQCRRLRFDFIRCHKDAFRICMGVLPAYMDIIEELALSEQNAPGQFHALLSFYPSFSAFKQLRRLYFDVNMEAIEVAPVRLALHSLSCTSLETLSIKIVKSSNFADLKLVIVELFRMKTLKKLIVACDIGDMHWESLGMVSSNIKYLVIKNTRCAYEDLQYIFQCASGLQYLDIGVSYNGSWSAYESKLSSKQSIPQMSMLHTAIFNTDGRYRITHRQLEPYFRCMPSLHRLEIKTPDVWNDFSGWETVLQTSLPSLNYFILEVTKSDQSDVRMPNTLESIQTRFWIKKQNFNIFLKRIVPSNIDRFSVANLNTLNHSTH